MSFAVAPTPYLSRYRELLRYQVNRHARLFLTQIFKLTAKLTRSDRGICAVVH